MTNPNKKYTNVSAIAEESGIEEKILYRLVARRDCSFAVRLGPKAIRINREHFQKWLDEGGHKLHQPPEGSLTTKELAEYFDISESTVGRLISTRGLKPVATVGHTHYYSPTDVAALEATLEAEMAGGRTEPEPLETPELDFAPLQTATPLRQPFEGF